MANREELLEESQQRVQVLETMIGQISLILRRDMTGNVECQPRPLKTLREVAVENLKDAARILCNQYSGSESDTVPPHIRDLANCLQQLDNFDRNGESPNKRG